MQTRPFQIRTHFAQSLITITFDTVFWDQDIADRFKAECLAAVASLGCAPGQHSILVDLSNAMLQTQDVYEKMRAFAGSATARRIALVASSPLARMQTKRLQLRDNIMMFADLAGARAWLLDNSETGRVSHRVSGADRIRARARA